MDKTIKRPLYKMHQGRMMQCGYSDQLLSLECNVRAQWFEKKINVYANNYVLTMDVLSYIKNY